MVRQACKHGQRFSFQLQDTFVVPSWAPLRASGFDLPAAFQLYQQARVARTARVVLSVREMGRLYHATGVERLVRNSLWIGRTPDRYYDAMEWLYRWRPERCLADASPPARLPSAIAA